MMRRGPEKGAAFTITSSLWLAQESGHLERGDIRIAKYECEIAEMPNQKLPVADFSLYE
jgi:hypothetical protein